MAATALKIISIGNSLGVILPKDILSQLHVEKGDKIFLTDTPDGFRVGQYTDELEEAMNLAESIMRQDRDVLRELAK
jgi:putative addiction module antidote